MSIQWTFIACCLYLEIAIVLLLILPIASPRKWSKLFNSRLCSFIKSYAAFYFYTILMVMGLLLVDSIRDMRKYSNPSDTSHTDFATGMKGNIKLFRAQRNFYITGFAIFLVVVIRRIIAMILIQAQLLEKSANLVCEADKATNLAKETIVAHKLEHSSMEDKVKVERLQDQLTVAEQAIHAQVEMIKSMTVEMEEWREKCKSLMAQQLQREETTSLEEAGDK